MLSWILPAVFLLPMPASAPAAGLRIEKTATSLKVYDGEALFTEYVFAGTVQEEKSKEQKPLAKPYFYPVIAPNGVPVTRGWPMVRGTAGETTDHFHQKSAWFCHGDVIPEGLELKIRSGDKRVKGVDYWSETKGHGRIVCMAVSEPERISADHVVISTKNEWQAADGTPILAELRKLHFQKFPKGRLITLDITLLASHYPIIFGDTKEGSMGVRVHDDLRSQLKGKGNLLVNAKGASSEKDVWGYESDWCDYTGVLDGKAVGVSVFDAKSNPYRAAWHARGYGLLAANPFGRKEAGFPSRKTNTELVKLPKGQSLKLKYGIYAHDGNTAEGQVAEIYQNFTK